ncbi:MAG: hypothetical protein INR68_08620 [Methylobacterium mesophilicum]|nr:hypothetical protein [Methylobacterium mesophilicum]
MKKFLAASALVLAMASPVLAQNVQDRLSPNISDQPSRWMNNSTGGFNDPSADTNVPSADYGVDYGTTQSIRQNDRGVGSPSAPSPRASSSIEGEGVNADQQMNGF